MIAFGQLKMERVRFTGIRDQILLGIEQAEERVVRGRCLGGRAAAAALTLVCLGIFNLLPIPVLDGGAIFLLLIEGMLALIGLSISSAVRDRIQQVGFVMVLLLMVFVISNDVLKLFRGSSEPESPPAATAPAK